VIDRGIETALLAHLAQHAARLGAKWLVGEYIPTRKNAPCADFYTAHGFIEDASFGEAGADSVFYLLDLTENPPSSPAWLTLEGNELNELAASAVVTS
jgi:predicted enzyme involved in methoxymalonyl-ACP biosynthesis